MNPRAQRRIGIFAAFSTLLALGSLGGACTTIEVVEVGAADASGADTSVQPVEPDAADTADAAVLPENDKTPPKVTLSVTPARVTVAGKVELRVVATDPSGISNVTIYQRDGSVLEAFTTAPYTIRLDVTADDNGLYTFTAKATDKAGNVGASNEVTLDVDVGGVTLDGGVDGAALCVGVTCTTPPATSCSSATNLRSYDAAGTCVSGVCRYAVTNKTCPFGCEAGACKPDPCIGVTCATPPPDTCRDRTTRRTYPATGTCASGVCSYAPTDMACAYGCASGVCAASFGPATAVAAGFQTTCAIVADGSLKCWGQNARGQVGNNGTLDRQVPTDVGIASGVVSVALGDEHTCALFDTGAVKCWGRNDHGQVGNNGTLNRQVPTDVVGLGAGVAKIYVKHQQTCAIMDTGAVKCWGLNSRGQIGNNGTLDRQVPTDVTGLTSGITALALGDEHVCALDSGGGVQCWGRNDRGQVGNNGTLDRRVPTAVVGLSSGVAAIYAHHQQTCALMATGGVKCWGRNDHGQVGNNGTLDRIVPTDVVGLDSGVASLALGDGHVCALDTAGGVQCWGQNDHGQVGNNSTLDRIVPAAAQGLGAGVAAVYANGNQTCALMATGGVKCWGINANGQVGNNGILDRQVPTDCVGLSAGATALTLGDGHVCALMATGALKCWGLGNRGQIGNNGTLDRQVPTDLLGFP
ncbi:MAG: Ig-like domain-containing protein [Polyangiaceae bacterium]